MPRLTEIENNHISSLYILPVPCRRERTKRSEDGPGAAPQHPDKARESHQRSPMRSARALRRHSADVTGSAVDLVADGRADPIRQAVRGGTHRQSASGNIPGRHHVGDERHRHPLTNLEHCAGQLHEQQRESQ